MQKINRLLLKSDRTRQPTCAGKRRDIMWKNASLKSVCLLESHQYCRLLLMLTLLMLLALLPACSTTVTRLTIPPVKCSEYVPKEVWEPVQGVDASLFEVLKDWAGGFVGQTGKLEEANIKPPYIKHTLETCEKHEREIYNSLHGKKRRFLGVF